MTIYTKNGKPILKNVNGVYKLVTGDCCCGCASDSQCGLPHLEIDLGNPASSGSVPTSMMPTLTMRFEPVNGGGIDQTSQYQAVYDSNKQKWDWNVVTNPEPEWETSCLSECESKKRTNKLRWTGNPNIILYPRMWDFRNNIGSLHFSLANVDNATISLDVIVQHSYLCAVVFEDKQYRAARYNPPNGSAFTLSLGESERKEVKIVKV